MIFRQLLPKYTTKLVEHSWDRWSKKNFVEDIRHYHESVFFHCSFYIHTFLFFRNRFDFLRRLLNSFTRWWQSNRSKRSKRSKYSHVLSSIDNPTHFMRYWIYLWCRIALLIRLISSNRNQLDFITHIWVFDALIHYLYYDTVISCGVTHLVSFLNRRHTRRKYYSCC